MQYAHYISATEIQYPNYATEFHGIPNPQSNEAAMRKKGYMPLTDVPPQQEGKTLTLTGFELVPRTITRTVTRYREVIDYDTDENGEQHESGRHMEPYETTVEQDASFIRVTSCEYIDITPPEPPDTTERDATEKQIVSLIFQFAKNYDAINDIAQMEDITIPNLEALAVSKGVALDSPEFQSLITSLTPLKWQLEAIEDKNWAQCWQGLKSRFASYMEEILAEAQQAQSQQ